VVYLMGKVNIKNQWVYCILYRWLLCRLF
jgi:hypothetical protein